MNDQIYTGRGVAKYLKISQYFCAICDEEKFRETTGIDLHNE